MKSEFAGKGIGALGLYTIHTFIGTAATGIIIAVAGTAAGTVEYFSMQLIFAGMLTGIGKCGFRRRLTQ
jgi:hypothetical protein